MLNLLLCSKTYSECPIFQIFWLRWKLQNAAFSVQGGIAFKVQSQMLVSLIVQFAVQFDMHFIDSATGHMYLSSCFIGCLPFKNSHMFSFIWCYPSIYSKSCINSWWWQWGSGTCVAGGMGTSQLRSKLILLWLKVNHHKLEALGFFQSEERGK